MVIRQTLLSHCDRVKFATSTELLRDHHLFLLNVDRMTVDQGLPMTVDYPIHTLKAARAWQLLEWKQARVDLSTYITYITFRRLKLTPT